MATARKTTPRKTTKPKTAPTPKPAEPECTPCRGSGWVSESYCVGRRKRHVGETDVLCARCLGSGIDPTPDRW